MLVTMRDQNLPMPAGAILISPWVDLTHSFPSVAKGSSLDYLPEHGFLHRPSGAWPPPSLDDLAAIHKSAESYQKTGNGSATAAINATASYIRNEASEEAVNGFTVRRTSMIEAEKFQQQTYSKINKIIKPIKETIGLNEADILAVPMLDGTIVEIKDQIQMYAPNQLLSHPLVSPVLQPSLGGLPPMLIVTGGGELLHDEQVYLAHKAANPAAYPPHDPYLDEHDPDRTILNKYGPTYVQLQIWDDVCHVLPTLSWTRPAKFMYRSIAQFGAWALARAQSNTIDIPENDASSISSKASTSCSSIAGAYQSPQQDSESVGKAGDPLPAFRKHMIRQRVDLHGKTYPLDPPHVLPALQQPTSKVGAVNPEMVAKWLTAKREWDHKFAREKIRVQQRRIEEFMCGYHRFDGEQPPACALAGRRVAEVILPKTRAHKSWAMSFWSKIASRHDKDMVEMQEKAEGIGHINSADVDDQGTLMGSRPTSRRREVFASRSTFRTRPRLHEPEQSAGPSKSRARAVSDGGQANETLSASDAV